MALPRKLKHLNVFADGSSYLGQVEEYTPAKLAKKFEKYRGGGMLGAADMDMGYDDDALATEAVFGGYVAELMKKHSADKHDAVQLRFAGSFQRDDTGEIQAVEIITRGRIKEIDRGNYKSGDNSTTKFAFTNTYYRETVDGVDVVEIDLVNMVEKIDGVDKAADHRKALGL